MTVKKVVCEAARQLVHETLHVLHDLLLSNELALGMQGAEQITEVMKCTTKRYPCIKLAYIPSKC